MRIYDAFHEVRPLNMLQVRRGTRVRLPRTLQLRRRTDAIYAAMDWLLER